MFLTKLESCRGEPRQLLLQMPRKQHRNQSESFLALIATQSTDLVNVVQKYEPRLRRTQSFFEEDTQSSSSKTSSKNKSKLFQFVKKTGSTLRSGLVTSKELSLGSKHGKTEPCSKKNCKCCGLILSKENISVKGKKIESALGTCKTYNIVYLVQCSICKKNYVGRTVNSLHKRLDGHQSKFY